MPELLARVGDGRAVLEQQGREGVPHLVTAKGAARHLAISPSYAGLLLKRGVIPGTQAVPGSMWWVDPAVLDSPQLRETLRALSERRRVQRDHDDRTLKIPGLSEV